MGRRQRQREKQRGQDQGEKLTAASSEYTDPDGGVLTLRGSLSPPSRREYAELLAGGLDREDAWQRAAEFLFERLAVSWTIAGLQTSRQKELLARYRIASQAERQFIRDALREHVSEHFPELQAP